jgi:dihydrofolate synthase/folylpolyglutamate synthase
MVFLPHFPIPNKNSISDNSPEKLKKILAKLGFPQDNLPPTIQVAGTNGKGSAVAFLASIFQAAGYKSHIFTSPHLHHCNERIVIANNQIDDGYLYEMLEEVRIASEGINLTLFEGLTLAAILAFSKNSADICIIETGMGGRVDATNVIDKKIATILTSISLDHQEYLGNNLSAIACEKSHIMRPNVPCVIAQQNIEVVKAIELRSSEICNPLIYFGKDFQIKINDDETFNFKYTNPVIPTKVGIHSSFANLPKPSLPGWHQYLNASLAIAAILVLSSSQLTSSSQRKLGSQQVGQDPSFRWDDAIRNGLKQTKWISRLEKLNHNLLRKNDELWIDGAHNEGGFIVLADWLKEQIFDDFENKKPKRNYLIVGFTKNKTKPEFFIPFKDMIDFVCAIRVAGEPNPEEAETIFRQVKISGIEEVKTEDDLIDAINFLVNLDQENPCRIIICGSLYLARDFKAMSYA